MKADFAEELEAAAKVVVEFNRTTELVSNERFHASVDFLQAIQMARAAMKAQQSKQGAES